MQQTTDSGKESPRCSVIMPVYDTEESLLRAAIESILHQTFSDLELIVVDDCSAASVGEVVGAYAAADARVRYVRLAAQGGAAAARNHALGVARGEFVAFMDSDDISLPERLAKQVAYLDAHPEVSCLGTEYNILTAKGMKKAPQVPHEHEGIVSYLLFCGCAFCQSSVMLRRSLLEEPTPLRYRAELEAAHDCHLWFDLIGRARFAILPEPLVRYRLHAQSITGRAHELQVRKMAQGQVELFSRLGGAALAEPQSWERFLAGATLTHEEYAELSRCLMQVADALQTRHGYPAAAVLSALRRRLRKAFHRTRSMRGQWELLRLPVRRYAGLPLWWCSLRFIIKGIF